MSMRDEFEALFPVPKDVEWIGNGYAPTKYSADQGYNRMWKVWQAARSEGGQSAELDEYQKFDQELCREVFEKLNAEFDKDPKGGITVYTEDWRASVHHLKRLPRQNIGTIGYANAQQGRVPDRFLQSVRALLDKLPTMGNPVDGYAADVEEWYERINDPETSTPQPEGDTTPGNADTGSAWSKPSERLPENESTRLALVKDYDKPMVVPVRYFADTEQWFDVENVDVAGDQHTLYEVILWCDLPTPPTAQGGE